MCDKGMLEADPTLMKLEYCIAINKEIQDYIEKEISKLIGSTAKIIKPKVGEYPDGKNEICIVNMDKYTELQGKRFYDDVCYFYLREMPGCCGILVSYHMYVYPKYKKMGIAWVLQDVKEKIARNNGYTIIMCTTRLDNEIENHILEKSGWKIVDSLQNRRTLNHVLIWKKEVKYD